LDLSHIKSSLYNIFNLNRHNQQSGDYQVLVKKKKEKKDNDKDGGIKAFLVGLGLGTIGFGILSFFVKPRCPNCNEPIEKNIPQCPHCGRYLHWN
jgi:zinc-ribbon domain